MNAYPQGSIHSLYPVLDVDDPNRDKIEHEVHELGFTLFTNAHRKRFPLLDRVLLDRRPAKSTKIEWLVDRIHEGKPRRFLEYNCTQILRVPAAVGGGETVEDVRDRTFDQLCGDMEQVLWDGHRSGMEYGIPLPELFITTCGGVREFLSRGPNPNDQLTLRSLRDPVFRVTRYPDELGGTVIGEWITEFSLQVIPREA